jgi:hypothetical protein
MSRKQYKKIKKATLSKPGDAHVPITTSLPQKIIFASNSAPNVQSVPSSVVASAKIQKTIVEPVTTVVLTRILVKLTVIDKVNKAAIETQDAK